MLESEMIQKDLIGFGGALTIILQNNYNEYLL